MDHLGPVQTADRFSQSVVVAVADAADRWLDPDLGQALGIFDRYILAAPVAVVDEATAMKGATLVNGLLQSSHHEGGMRAVWLTQRQLALGIGSGERFIVNLEAGKPTAQLGKALAAAWAVGMRLRSDASPAATLLKITDLLRRFNNNFLAKVGVERSNWSDAD